MILFAFGEHQPEDLASPRRWAFELVDNYVGLVEQAQWGPGGSWVGLGGRYVLLAWTPSKCWQWRREHLYYDGPHDGLLLGPLQLWWSWNWCAKCAGEDE